ncbi:MAG: IS21 family transposase, partial [Fibrobacterota bacterium]
MGNYLRMEQRQQIQAFIRLGWSDRAISRASGLDRGTVAKYREGFQNQPQVPADFLEEKGQNPPEVPTDHPPFPGTHSIQIQPHLELIRRHYLQHLSAQWIYQELVDCHGYRGSYDSVKRYVRKLRKRIRAFKERLPHLPGREVQVDFGKSPCFVKDKNGRYRRMWLFKATLSCSKHAYEELVERQDLETFIRCHERAFQFFGGVPEIVTLDNIKSGVLLANMYDPVVNPVYLAFSSYWGFAANPCMPRRPEHKGVVERDIGYTKSNGLAGRKFEDLEAANLYLRHWNKQWARTRIHGTTKCQVWKLFCELEHPRLRPLAEKPFAFFKTGQRKVDVNGLVEVESCYYGVPPRYVGDSVIVHYNQEKVSIFKEEVLLITHSRQHRKGYVSQPPSCLPSWKHPSQESQEQYYCRQAKQVGPNFHELINRTLEDDHPLTIRRVRGLLSLRRMFSQAILEESAGRALRKHHCRYQDFRYLCEAVALYKAPEPAQLTQQHELIRPLREYESLLVERTL